MFNPLVLCRWQVLLLLILFSSLVPSSIAQALSAGCALLNDPFYGGYVTGGELILTFNANEQVTITASYPSDYIPNQEIVLLINGAFVDTAIFPATLSYTFTSDGTYTVYWSSNAGQGGFATWTLSCGIGQPSSATESEDGAEAPCPVFHDGRINHCDTFNPVVLYGRPDNEDNWRLEVYHADGSGLLFAVPAEVINTVERCPANNTLIYED